MSKKPRALGDLDAQSLRCRELDHAWGEPTDVVTARTKSGFILEIERRQVCMRTELLPPHRWHARLQVIPTDTFVPTKSTIVCPEDYYLHGVGRVTKAEIRRESFNRNGKRRK